MSLFGHSYDGGVYFCLFMQIYMLIFIGCMRSFNKQVRNRFVSMIVAEMIACIMFMIDDYMASYDYIIFVRYMVKVLKLTCEGWIEYQAVIVLDNVPAEKRKKVAIPFIITTLVLLTTPFNPLVIEFTSRNTIAYGPLAYIIYVQAAFYLGYLLWISYKMWNGGDKNQATIIQLVVISFIVGIFLEGARIFHSSILCTITGGTIIMYMFLYAQRYNVDSVTHCYKRRVFYSDGAKYSRHQMAVLSMDLNDLKLINDNYGHRAGDIALQTFAECAKEIKPKNYILYRTGGDEFMMLGINSDEQEAQLVMEKLKEQLARTKYSSSIGYAMYSPVDDFDEVVVRADQSMYADKKAYKHMRHCVTMVGEA